MMLIFFVWKSKYLVFQVFVRYKINWPYQITSQFYTYNSNLKCRIQLMTKTHFQLKSYYLCTLSGTNNGL